ncbi:hypothetical protein PV327_009107 [Microctonus hyperodae]|uniref:Lysophospholipid acyltransferase 5 n=1 Tax=Microctonus hyperodae TaxID=165561 RepID=A0AA39FTD7_MICHY|nr:hypothetical protein PV327_009107 [Microctonus hyperodae]
MIEVEGERVTTATMMGGLANYLGCAEPALRLLISIFLGFPFAIIYRRMLYKKPPCIQHIYFIVCGLLLGFWNFGWTIGHSAFALCATYLILFILGGTTLSVLITFIFNMAYLSYGYWTTTTDDYDIKWTMPHCVLTLRLIGLAFNYSDGHQDESKLSINQKKVSLKVLPSFLEVAAFVYFPGSFLVGPQFSIKSYLDYVNGNLVECGSKDNKPSHTSLEAGINRAIIGCIYLAIYQLGSSYVSDQYMMSDEFYNENYIKRLLLLGLWGRLHLYKYISCWLLTEGVCMTFGLSYNGKDKNGIVKWDGCKNVDLWTFENATQFNHYILSFNMNTNHWCAEYVYKRLKFLGSRHASQFFTLLFLAVWHGFHSGYYVTFMMEFIIMYFEKDIAPALLKNNQLQMTINSFPSNILVWFVMKLYTLVFMGYSFCPFILLSYTRYVGVYSSVYWIGHLVFFSYPLIAPFIKPIIRGKNNSQRLHRD